MYNGFYLVSTNKKLIITGKVMGSFGLYCPVLLSLMSKFFRYLQSKAFRIEEQ